MGLGEQLAADWAWVADTAVTWTWRAVFFADDHALPLMLVVGLLLAREGKLAGLELGHRLVARRRKKDRAERSQKTRT